MLQNVFNGGLHLRPAPHLIQKTEARQFVNIDNEKGILTPINDKTEAVESAQKYAFYFRAEDEWQFASTPTDWVEFQDRLYTADRTNQPTVTFGGNTYNLGVVAPTGTVTLALDGAGNVDGTVQYAITYYNSTLGAESAPLVTEAIVASSNKIDLTNIPVSADAQVDQKRIYRIGGAIATFTLVDTITNATTSYEDDIATIDLQPDQLQTAQYAPAPVGLKFLTEAYAMLWGVVGKTVRFTPIGVPEAWPVFYSIPFADEPTGISPTANGLLIHVIDQTYLLTGTGPDAIARQLLSADQGCVNHDTSVTIGGTALWVSQNGICASDGGAPEVITRVKYGDVSFDTVNAVVHKEEYYLQLTDGTTFIVDFNDRILKESEYGIESVVTAENVLYGFYDGSLWSIETSDDLLSMTYQSPTFIGLGYREYKSYKNFKVVWTGDVQIKVYIDGVLSNTFNLSSTKDKVEELKLKQNVGLSAYYTVTGTGTVYEVEFEEAPYDA